MIETQLLSGSGSTPKNVGRGSVVLFDASNLGAESYQWFLNSKPENSAAVITNVNQAYTRLMVIDVCGVYQLAVLAMFRNGISRRYVAAVSVPDVISPEPLPDEPIYDSGGAVRNFSFELPGLLPGHALSWDTEDTENVLGTAAAGVSRGRIQPEDFLVFSGKYAMCLGDDIGAVEYFRALGEFSITQEVDFTGVSYMTLQLKFKK